MEQLLPKGKCIIFSAPSGAGKTTIVHALLKNNPSLAFSVSACSREPRAHEVDGVDYYFIGVDGFRKEIEEKSFVEWEEVYENHFYGTLKREVYRLWKQGKTVVFDVDVYGGINLKDFFKENALSIFIEPPSLSVLEERLRKRQTESEDRIHMRLQKAEEELQQKKYFDRIIINENLEKAIQETEKIVSEYIK